jgi:hypothetical protein
MRLFDVVLAAAILVSPSGRAGACPGAPEPLPAPAEATCMFPADIQGNEGLCDLIAYVEYAADADTPPDADGAGVGAAEALPPEARPTDTGQAGPQPHESSIPTALVLARSVYEGDEIAGTHPVDTIELTGKVPPGHAVAFHCLRNDQPDSTLAAVAPLDHDQPVNAMAAWEVDFERRVFVETSPDGVVCEMGSGDGAVPGRLMKPGSSKASAPNQGVPGHFQES